MLRKMMILTILLFFGTGVGFLLGVASGVELSGHDHSGHDHNVTMDITGNTPSVSMALHPDAISGWNLQVVTQNFEFTPKSVNMAHEDGTGHAHVYVNGEKLMRIYSEWTHIPSLPLGQAQLTVALNSNTHSPLSVNGIPIEARTTIQVNK